MADKGFPRPLKFDDADKLQADIDAYFDSCNEVIPTLEGLAVHLKCGTSTIRDYCNDLYEHKDKTHHARISAILKLARERLGCKLVNHGLSARNPAMQIFLLKNHYSYRDWET